MSLADFVHENPTGAMLIVAGVAVVFVFVGGGSKKSPNATPVNVPNAKGTDTVSNEELQNALNDQHNKILEEIRAQYDPAHPGQPPQNPGGQGGQGAPGGQYPDGALN